MKTGFINISGASKLLILTAVALVGITVFLIYSNYTSQLKLNEEKELSRLDGIVSTLALQIDGDVHEKLIKTYGPMDAIQTNDQDPEYQELYSILKKAQVENQLETTIYTMVYDSTRSKFCFGVSSSDQPFWKHVYDDFPVDLLQQYNSGGTLPMYADTNGTWLSAFEPIRNSKGKAVAVLQVDEQFDRFIVEARERAMKSSWISLAVSGVITLILFFVTRTFLLTQQRLNREREELETLRKELLANVSHDLRTPLSSIQGYLETVLMKKDTLGPEKLERYLAISLKNTEKLKSLVDELFDLSKLESKDRKLALESFSIAELALDVASSFKIKAAEKGINLTEEIPQSLPHVKADIALIDRVLQNLLSNAIKFTDIGGQIAFKLEDQPNHIRISVKDTGVGIAEDDLSKVFDRFHTRPSGKTIGTGLGLAIVRTVLEAHNSSFAIDSKVGIGTTFWFELEKCEN
ncbi:MAG: HAMP domain-containing sensor histidine kinase [Flavobacteriales bacterium]|nr:HAMP domain-containing sensor histidine kinase [Flavobacteriales bacterium]MDG1779901.1 HAMP domain-containing sensor histidine kinase [Flavobacteriales bacterium]MDG2246057.1 HAMP domain-containing sensor histidine kinase [Flavobacteriales bacterium]